MSIHQDTFRCYLPHMFKLTEEQILIFVVVHFYASAVVDFFAEFKQMLRIFEIAKGQTDI